MANKRNATPAVSHGTVRPKNVPNNFNFLRSFKPREISSMLNGAFRELTAKGEMLVKFHDRFELWAPSRIA